MDSFRRPMMLIVLILLLCCSLESAHAQAFGRSPTAGEVVGQSILDAGNAVQNYMASRDQLRRRIARLRRERDDCQGTCAQARQIDDSLASLERDETMINSIEQQVLASRGLGRYGTFENLLDAAVRDARGLPQREIVLPRDERIRLLAQNYVMAFCLLTNLNDRTSEARCNSGLQVQPILDSLYFVEAMCLQKASEEVGLVPDIINDPPGNASDPRFAAARAAYVRCHNERSPLTPLAQAISQVCPEITRVNEHATRRSILSACRGKFHPLLAANVPPSGPSLLGIRIGMPFAEAERIIRAHMDVGQRVTTDYSPQAIPAQVAGVLFVDKQHLEYIMIFDSHPPLRDRVVMMSRGLFIRRDDVREQLDAIIRENGPVSSQSEWMTVWGGQQPERDCYGSETLIGRRMWMVAPRQPVDIGTSRTDIFNTIRAPRALVATRPGVAQATEECSAVLMAQFVATNVPDRGSHFVVHLFDMHLLRVLSR